MMPGGASKQLSIMRNCDLLNGLFVDIVASEGNISMLRTLQEIVARAQNIFWQVSIMK